MTHSGMLVALVVALLSAPAADIPQAAQQAPSTFRVGVDLVVVDVVVVDTDGLPVTDLVATDFSVTTGKHPRRIVSSEFVAAKRISTEVATYAPGLPISESMSTRSPCRLMRAFEAMMTMGKIDIATIEAARRG